MPAAPPEIGPYRVLGPLGRGGMGTVWLAEDPRLARRVAIKLFAGPEARTEYARDQLLREARAAAALSHANIAAVHDVVDIDGQVAVVFEYVEGETLAARIGRGPLSVSAVFDLARQLADALWAAHERGIVHRDLKPANIVMTRDGGVKVLDFGVARVLPAGSDGSGIETTAGGFVGTIGYAAPEQCLGQPGDSRADMFSLGVVLYEALTGQRPFPGADATTVMRAMLQDAPPRVAARASHVPAPLDALIARLLSAEPARRPQSGRDVREALQAIAPAAGALAPAAGRRAWATAALVSVALLTGALVSSLASNRPVSNTEKPPVVAVMPLTNASGDSSKDYLSLGIAESLITRLAALPSITVLSRTAVADVRARTKEIPAIAKELDATYLVDGSVQQVGDELNIAVSLVRPDGAVAWADAVRGPFTSIFELQTRLASTLGHALSVQLSAADRASLAKQPTMNAAALAAYWRGRALLDRRDVRGNTDAAIAAFDEAIRLDARYADAHAARGEALWARYIDTKDPAAADDAIAAGTTALRLDPNRPNVRYSLALSLAGSGRLDEALEELQHALALQPNYDDARRELGNVLARQGKLEEAVVELRKAIALRPQFWGHHSALGLRLYQAARYEEAAAAFQRVIELQPDNYIGYQQLGTVYQAINRDDEALSNYQRAIAIQPSVGAYSNMGMLLHRQGEYEKAIAAYTAAIKLRPNRLLSHGNLGDALRRVGREAEARAAYRTALRLAEGEMKVNPKDPLALASAAMYSAKAGELGAARRHIANARRLAPEDVEILFHVAVVHALAGETEAALDALEQAVQRGYSRSLIAEADEFQKFKTMARYRAIVGVTESTGGSPR
jgi:serine/threonine protein kinase/tetratricopeptide (TPR) repeat protein